MFQLCEERDDNLKTWLILGQCYAMDVKKKQNIISTLFFYFFTNIPLIAIIILFDLLTVKEIAFFAIYLPVFMNILMTIDGIKNTIFIKFISKKLIINIKKIITHIFTSLFLSILFTILLIVAVNFYGIDHYFFNILKILK